MIPDFRNCSTSPLPGCTTTDDRVGDVGDLGLGLAHADGLDHDHVECRRQRLGGRARRRCETAEALARGGRADQDALVGRVELDARAVAEQRAARAARARVDREHRHRLALRAPCVQQRGEQRRLARAGRSSHADDVPRRLAAERGGGDLAQQRRRLLAVGRRWCSPAGSARPARRSSRVRAGALPRRPRRSAAHAEPLAEAPSLPFGARAPTISTMSRMMRVMSKSFGV